jgi:hypothetical protein
MGSILRHALTNGIVLLLLGSLLIGIVADSRQAEGIRPFTTDIFKGFLAIFLLDMGMVTARRHAGFLCDHPGISLKSERRKTMSFAPFAFQGQLSLIE